MDSNRRLGGRAGSRKGIRRVGGDAKRDYVQYARIGAIGGLDPVTVVSSDRASRLQHLFRREVRKRALGAGAIDGGQREILGCRRELVDEVARQSGVADRRRVAEI